MKQIELTQGQVAMVDNIDYERVSAFKWYAQWAPNTQSFYAVRADYGGEKQKTVYMARFITGEPLGLHIDHINHATLDNRQENLRVCTCSQNFMNRKKHKNCSSVYKGVAWKKSNKKWQAYIQFEGKLKYLGLFQEETEAARAYDEAAIELFGEYALLNF